MDKKKLEKELRKYPYESDTYIFSKNNGIGYYGTVEQVLLLLEASDPSIKTITICDLPILRVGRIEIEFSDHPAETLVLLQNDSEEDYRDREQDAEEVIRFVAAKEIIKENKKVTTVILENKLNFAC